MSSDREALRLADIVDNIDAIHTYVGALGFDAFARDRMRVDATERCLERLIEAIVKIGPERMAVIAPGLPVHKLRGLGNILRHSYDLVDDEIVYSLATRELAKLRDACVAVMEA